MWTARVTYTRKATERGEEYEKITKEDITGETFMEVAQEVEDYGEEKILEVHFHQVKKRG